MFRELFSKAMPVEATAAERVSPVEPLAVERPSPVELPANALAVLVFCPLPAIAFSVLRLVAITPCAGWIPDLNQAISVYGS